MARIFKSADQLIGHTPLMELAHIEAQEGLNAKVLAKLEYFNPAGSVKDRIAKAMIDDAEARGALKPGAVRLQLHWETLTGSIWDIRSSLSALSRTPARRPPRERRRSLRSLHFPTTPRISYQIGRAHV